MKLRQLFENIYEQEGSAEDVAIMFGRFNPPHFGHVDAWRVAADFPEWYIGTNQSTQGPKDPLPFNIKIEAMKTLYPEIAEHLISEQSWFTLATMVYKKHGPVTLHVVTDDTDVKIYLPMLQKQNGLEGPHGFYRFKDIVWAEAERKSEASLVRKAVKENNPQDFETHSGVPADTVVGGHPYFKLVRHYMLPYMQAEEDKLKKQQEREQAKAEKAKLKADKAAGVTQPETDPSPAMSEMLTRIHEMEQELLETSVKNVSKREQQSTAGLNTYGDSERMSGDYTSYRLGMAVACANGKDPINMKGKTWIGKQKSTHPYTQEEQDMLIQAYKVVGAEWKDLNNGDMKSMELDTVNKVSPVAKRKTNKYGV